jgi:hypothetical protein
VGGPLGCRIGRVATAEPKVRGEPLDFYSALQNDVLYIRTKPERKAVLRRPE